VTSPSPLLRRLGPLDAFAIVAGSMLGVGIFLNPSVVAQHTNSPLGFMLLWIVGGAVALAGATAYAQLGAAEPEAGGDYVYLRRAFGPRMAAAGGALLGVVVFPASIAMMAVAFAQYQLPVLLGPLLNERGATWVADSSQLLGVFVVIAITLLNMAGARASGAAQVLLTLVPTVLLLGAAFIGLGAAPEVLPDGPLPGDTGASGWATAFMAVYFAYSGWNAAGYVGGEIRDPRRNLPLALIGGTLSVVATYLVLCTAFLAVFGVAAIRDIGEIGSAFAGHVFGPSAMYAAVALIGCGVLSSANSTVLGGARITWAMARDGILSSALTRTTHGARTPFVALVVQGAIAIVLALSGSWQQLLALSTIAMLLLGTLVVASLFVLRRRSPALFEGVPRFGFPLVPAFYVVTSGGVIVVASLDAARALFDSSRPAVEGLFPLLGLAVFAGALLLATFRGITATQRPPQAG
jgi:APA family basic amino acid/polyamine antiporter